MTSTQMFAERAPFDAHPALGFAHPDDVIGAGHLTPGRKREILASWASDAFAVEAAPALRQAPSGRAVPWDDIMAALKRLDGLSAANDDHEPPRRPPAARPSELRDLAA